MLVKKMVAILAWIVYNILVLLVSLVAVAYAYFKWSYQYWKRKEIPYFPPRIPTGNFPRSNKHIGVRIEEYYKEFKKRGYKHAGLYMLASPLYLPIDPDIIKNIIIKDFKYFTDRGLYQNEKDEPLSGHLIAMSGSKWKNLRAKLTPTFTSSKMKMMFPILVECSDGLQQTVQELSKSKEPLEIKEILSCFTTDVIGSCAFGLECNSFKEEDAPFRKYGRMVFKISGFLAIKRRFCFAFPSLARALRLRVMLPEVTNFFLKIVEETVHYRETNKITRNDFMQLLIDLKNNKDYEGEKLGIQEMAAQAFAFFVAGFETSSTTMAFCLYELASNLNIQQKVREEVVQILEKYDNHLSFEAVQEMKYLGQVLDETLRIYPAIPMLNRECIEDYKIPNENLVLEKGTRLIVPVLGLQHDPEYFPNPEVFDPDRFTEENKRNIHPSTYLPFGEGPRNCIGSRFGLLQSKVGLSVLLKNFEFALNSKTSRPLTMNPTGSVLLAKGGIWLNVNKTNQ